jgi:hypothetical protein
MPALSVIDLAMLETPECPFTVGPLIVLDPPHGGAVDALRWPGRGDLLRHGQAGTCTAGGPARLF